MTTNTNLYMDRIQQEHPIAAWTLDDEFTSNTPTVVLDSFFPLSSIVSVPIQSVGYSGGVTTITTSTTHGFSVNETVYFLPGIVPTSYRKRFRITAVPSTTSFRINTGSNLGNITTSGLVRKVYDAHELKSYNSLKYPGYVLTNKAPTSQMPVIYNSSKSQYGSVLLPSFGFLSNSGKYNQYTFEAWLKIKKSYIKTNCKLVGLFNSDPTLDDGNGLYYNDTSFILKLGSKLKSVPIKQLNKPLLIHITYSENSISLIINGEQLINLILDESDIHQLATPQNNKEYIFINDAVIDCPAIYPYKLSLDQTKVHYAYGQAALIPENIVRRYGGKNVSIDFASAKYASNLNYPINAEWKSGISDNLNINKYSISSKEYSLPTFNFYDVDNEEVKTVEQFLELYSLWEPKKWETSPGSGIYLNINSNVYFNNLNMLTSKLKGFYTHFTTTSLPLTTDPEKTIFKIINKFTKDSISITMVNNAGNIEIKYTTNINGFSDVYTQTNPYTLNSGTYIFAVGLDIDKFADYYDNGLYQNYSIATFFNNLNDLVMFAFGDNDINRDSTPDVWIRSIRFLTQEALNKKSSLVTTEGYFYAPSAVATTGSTEQVALTSPGSYGVVLKTDYVYNTSYPVSSDVNIWYYDTYFTFESYGYWKNSTPLNHFAKYVNDVGNFDPGVYTFNNIQYNVDYDSPRVNEAISGGIKNFNTSNSKLKSYITFEEISSEYKPDSYFTGGVKKLSIDRVVRPEDWSTARYKKYEVVDGTIIYPPTGVDLSTIAIVKHLEVLVSDGISNSVEVKSLEMASQALSLITTEQNPIYTKYGTKIIPYTYNTSTGVYNYSGTGTAINPFIIEKKTSPHLSLDRLTGIRLVGFDVTQANTARGLRVEINEKQNATAKVTSIHMFLFYDATADASQSTREAFQFNTAEIFNIVTSNKTLTGTLTNTSGVTGTYFSSATLSISSAGLPNDYKIKYYINGNLTTTPVINSNEWTILTIEFTEPLNFDNFVGQFNITGPIAFENISFYGLPEQRYSQNDNSASWELVWKPDFTNSQNWNSFSSSPWSNLLYVNNPIIEPNKINDLYLGNNILYPGIYKRSEAINITDVEFRLYGGYKSVKYTYSAN